MSDSFRPSRVRRGGGGEGKRWTLTRRARADDFLFFTQVQPNALRLRQSSSQGRTRLQVQVRFPSISCPSSSFSLHRSSLARSFARLGVSSLRSLTHLPLSIVFLFLSIFYPDLINPQEAPTYRIIKDKDEPEIATIIFKAGPPYEDIAFKIVNREWEHSHKRLVSILSSLPSLVSFYVGREKVNPRTLH